MEFGDWLIVVGLIILLADRVAYRFDRIEAKIEQLRKPVARP